MSRRSDVVRSQFTADPTTPRPETGGCVIYCYTYQNGSIGDINNPSSIGPITVAASESYQRVFMSGTISNPVVDSGALMAFFETPALGAIGRVDIPSGYPACATAVGDLSAGTHDIYLRLAALNSGASGHFGAVTFQVIIGQQVTTPGCPGGGGGSS